MDMVISRSVTALGRTFNYAETLTSDGAVTKEPSLAAAKAGTLSTRTGDTVGTLTLDTGTGSRRATSSMSTGPTARG